MSVLPLTLEDARYLVKTLEPPWDLEGRLLNGGGRGTQRSVQLGAADIQFLVTGLERMLSPEMSPAKTKRPVRLLQEITGMQFENLPEPGKRLYCVPYQHECEELGLEPCPPLFDETLSCFSGTGPGPLPLPNLRSCFLRGDRVQRTYRHFVRRQRAARVSMRQLQEDYESNRSFCRERLLDISLTQALNELEPRLIDEGFVEGRLSDFPLGRYYLAIRMHFAFRIVALGQPALAVKHLQELLAWDARDYYRITWHVAALQLVASGFRGYRASVRAYGDESTFWDLLRFLHSLQLQPDRDRARLLSSLCDKNPHMLEELCKEESKASQFLENPLPPECVLLPAVGSRLEARWAVQILKMAGADGFTELIQGLHQVFGHGGVCHCRIPESLWHLDSGLIAEFHRVGSDGELDSRGYATDHCLRWLREKIEVSPWELSSLTAWQSRYLVRCVAIASLMFPPRGLRKGIFDVCHLFSTDREYVDLIHPVIAAASPEEMCAEGTVYLHAMRERMQDLPSVIPGLALDDVPRMSPELESHVTFEIMHAQDLWNCNRSAEAIEHLEETLDWLGFEHRELRHLLLVRSLGQMDLARVRNVLEELRTPDDLVAEMVRFVLAALGGQVEECRDILGTLETMNPHVAAYLSREKRVCNSYRDPLPGSQEEAESACFALDMCWTIEVMDALFRVDLPEELKIWSSPVDRRSPFVETDVLPTPELVIVPSAKVGRNELCPCGSGKKYKKCCG